MVFRWSLSDSKFPPVSRTFLSILADPNTVVIWMVLVRPSISNFSSSFIKALEAVLSAPTTISITVTLMFYSFLVLWQGLSNCLSFRFLLFSLCGSLGRHWFYNKNALDNDFIIKKKH